MPGVRVQAFFTSPVPLLFRRSPEHDWAVAMQNTSPSKWAFGLLILFVFISAFALCSRVLREEALKRGVGY
jgi:hypothetical protein